MAIKKGRPRVHASEVKSKATGYIAANLSSTDFIRMGRDGLGETSISLDTYRAEVEMTQLDREELAAEIRDAVEKAMNPTQREINARKRASAGIERLAKKLAGSGLSSVQVVREFRGEI